MQTYSRKVRDGQQEQQQYLPSPPPSSPPPSSPMEVNNHQSLKRARMPCLTMSADSSKRMTAHPSKRSTKRLKRSDTSTGVSEVMVQMHFDLLPTRVTCKECGMSYTKIATADVALHAEFHTSHLYGIAVSLPSTASTRLAPLIPSTQNRNSHNQDDAYKMIEIRLSAAKKGERATVQKICDAVDFELSSTLPALSSEYVAYFTLHKTRCISFLLVQSLEHAFPLLANGELDASDRRNVCMGVSRMWTSKTHRGQGKMTAMLDHARRRFVYGYTVMTCEIGFTQLSHSGLSFATRYSRRHHEGGSKMEIDVVGAQADTVLVYAD